MNDLVEIKDGQPVVNSLKVADKFGKAHRDVLKAIRNLDCSEDFILRNFAPSSYTNRQNKTVPCYLLTRDGFSFLCMGFTGKEAAKWKEARVYVWGVSPKLDTPTKQTRIQKVSAR